MITVTSRVMKNRFYTAYIVCSEIRLKKIMTWAIFREELIKYLCFNFTSIFFKKTMISTLTFIFFFPQLILSSSSTGQESKGCTVLQNWAVKARTDISLNNLCSTVTETKAFTKYEAAYSKEAVPLKTKPSLISCWNHDVILHNYFRFNGCLLS